MQWTGHRWLALATLTFSIGYVANRAVTPAAESSHPSLSNAATIPFRFVSGRVMVSARVNGSEPASVMIDTGYSINMLSPELVEALELKRSGHITIVGIAGEERAKVFDGATFDFGGATYSPRRVAALPASYQKRWRKRDG